MRRPRRYGPLHDLLARHRERTAHCFAESMRRCRAADMMVGPSCRKWSRRARHDKGKRSRRTSGIAQITPGREALNWPGCTTSHPRSAADPDGAFGADVPDAAAPATLDAPGAAADWSGAAANQSAATDTR